MDHGLAIPKLLSLLAFHDPNATVQGLDTVPPRTARRSTSCALAFQTMVGIGTLLARCRRWSSCFVRWRRRRLPRVALVLPRAGGRRAAVGRRADRRLGRRRRSGASRGSSTA